MKVSTLLLTMAGIAIIGFSIAFAYKTFVIGSQQPGETQLEELRDACRDLKQVQCQQGNISRGDYTENCFRNGEHILKDPYTCPG